MTILEAAIIILPAATVVFGWIWAERKPAARPVPTAAEVEAAHAALSDALRRDANA